MYVCISKSVCICPHTYDGGEEGSRGGSRGEFLELGILLQALDGGKQRLDRLGRCSQCVATGRRRDGGGERDVVAGCGGVLTGSRRLARQEVWKYIRNTIVIVMVVVGNCCLLYTSPSPRDS